MPSERLLVFLKEPVGGRVKTRLALGIGAQAAARAYIAMAREVAATASRLPGVRVAWVYDGSRDLAWLGASGGDRWPQGRGDLGEKISRAFDRAFREGARRVCVIGTDSPDLPAGRLKKAFSVLKRADAVLGPTQDGGYYLLGLAGRQPGLFSRISWSGPRVFAQTLLRARRGGLRTRVLARHYDVDSPAELVRWLSRRVSAVSSLPARMGPPRKRFTHRTE